MKQDLIFPGLYVYIIHCLFFGVFVGVFLLLLQEQAKMKLYNDNINSLLQMENFVKVIIESKLNVNLFVCLEIQPLLFKDFRKINNKKKLKKKDQRWYAMPKEA